MDTVFNSSSSYVGLPEVTSNSLPIYVDDHHGPTRFGMGHRRRVVRPWVGWLMMLARNERICYMLMFT